MSRRAKAILWLGQNTIYSVGFGVAFMLAIGVGLFFYYRAEATATRVVRIAYGSAGPVRRHFLERLAQKAKNQRLDIRLIVSEGTAETVRMLEEGQADLGLITGAVEDQHGGEILEVMPLYMEPLQLLVRGALYGEVVKDFAQLRGKSIALDSVQSATNMVASELLRFIGLIDGAGTRQFSSVHLQQSELLAIKDAAALPDAIFQISGLPSPTMRHFITNFNYRLVPLPFGSSFNLEKFRQDNAASITGVTDLLVDRGFIEEFVIPAYSYSVLPPVPPEDARTIASRLLLVSGKDVEPRVVRRLLDAVLSPEISDLVRPPLHIGLLDAAFQFTRHPGTEQYVDALKPIDVDSAFTNYGRLVEVWGLIIAAYVAIASGLKKWQQRSTASFKSVGDFLKEVLAVEAAATATCTDAERTALDQQLTHIKKSVLDMHLEERLEHADSLPSLLVTLADTRTRIWGPVRMGPRPEAPTVQ